MSRQHAWQLWTSYQAIQQTIQKQQPGVIKQQKEKAEARLKHWLVRWAKQRGTLSGEGGVLLQMMGPSLSARPVAC